MSSRQRLKSLLVGSPFLPSFDTLCLFDCEGTERGEEGSGGVIGLLWIDNGADDSADALLAVLYAPSTVILWHTATAQKVSSIAFFPSTIDFDPTKVLS